MKKVFIIHENTKPSKVYGKSFDVVTEYVCAMGWVQEEEDKDPNCDSCYEPIFGYPEDGGTMELNQVLAGTYFDTYEKCQRALTQYLKFKTMNYDNILKQSKELAEKYPEALI